MLHTHEVEGSSPPVSTIHEKSELIPNRECVRIFCLYQRHYILMLKPRGFNHPLGLDSPYIVDRQVKAPGLFNMLREQWITHFTVHYVLLIPNHYQLIHQYHPYDSISIYIDHRFCLHFPKSQPDRNLPGCHPFVHPKKRALYFPLLYSSEFVQVLQFWFRREEVSSRFQFLRLCREIVVLDVFQ